MEVFKMEEYDEKYKPISPLGYVGYEILYALPVVGLICMIIFAITAKNVNVKNFARAQFVALIIGIILVFVLSLVAMISGVKPEQLQQMIQQS